VEVGAAAVLLTAVSGAVFGAVSLWRQLRSDARVERAERAAKQGQRAAQTIEERKVAFDELETAVETLGRLVDRANRRADECERREVVLLQRLSAVEHEVASLRAGR
jgi:glycogen debranching enzyme